jgi:hypothetical protein
MDFDLSFIFRNNSWTCLAFIDASDEPCYVFVQFKHKSLIEEFGEELTIKTDFEKRLPKKDDWGEVPQLRQAIFDALIEHPQFRAVKRQQLLTGFGKKAALKTNRI